MLKLIVKSFCLAVLSLSIAFVTSVSYVNAEYEGVYYTNNNDPCCQTSGYSLWRDNRALIGGIAIAGAVAGAIAGASTKGKKGHRGCQGAQQDVIWPRDIGQRVQFIEKITVVANVKPGGFLRLIQVVIGPDNEVFEGVAKDVTAGGNFMFDEIFINYPREGNYLVGYIGEASLAGGSIFQPNESFIMNQLEAPKKGFRSVLPFAVQVPDDGTQAGVNTTPIIYIKNL